MRIQIIGKRVRERAIVLSAAAGLAIAGVGAVSTPNISYAQSATATDAAQVSPQVSGPGAAFTFSASGFLGDVDDGEDDRSNNAELVSLWINTPDGRVIRAIRDEADRNHSETASTIRASRDGRAQWTWRAPADAVAGSYTMVARGVESGQTVTIPFTVSASARGALVGQGQAAPSVGTAGTRFSFTLSGFKGDADDGDDDKTNNAEEVVFWLNTPAGSTLTVERAGVDSDADNANRVRASRSGQATLEWVAPSNLQPGVYTLVGHGLESEREVVVTFTIQ